MTLQRLSVIVIGFVIGCGPSHQASVARVQQHDNNLRVRASFDMGCPKQELQVVPLKEEANAFHPDVKYAVLAGVSGCGKRATYVYDSARGVWLLNTDATPDRERAAATTAE
ncbi:MAG TPA: hypothetical protein VFQ53_30020 [Kofleriaceae bacterium]|nr:hypothetical protein [Kofleriaceae bacterium]